MIRTIREMSLRSKIIIGVLILAFAFGYYQISTARATRDTRAFTQLPEGTIRLINDGGETVTVSVRIADTSTARSRGFRGVHERVVSESVLYMVYPFNATVRHTVTDVPIPLDMAFFTEDGSLLQVFLTEVGEHQYRPDERYRHVIMAPQGFLARNSISVEGGARLVPDSLQRSPARQ